MVYFGRFSLQQCNMTPVFTSKSELAERLRISIDTLRSLCKEAGIDTGHRKLLWRTEVQRIEDAFDHHFQKSA